MPTRSWRKENVRTGVLSSRTPSCRAGRQWPLAPPPSRRRRAASNQGSDVLGRMADEHVQAASDIDRARPRPAGHVGRRRAGADGAGLLLLLVLVFAYDVFYVLMLCYLRIRWVGWGRRGQGMLCRVLCALLFVAWTAESAAGRTRSCTAATGEARSRSSARCSCPCPAINLFPWQVLMLALAPVCLLRARRLPAARLGHGRGHRDQLGQRRPHVPVGMDARRQRLQRLLPALEVPASPCSSA